MEKLASLILVVLACSSGPGPQPPEPGAAVAARAAGAAAQEDLEPRGPLVEELNLGFEAGRGNWHLRRAEVDSSVARFGERSVRLSHAGGSGYAMATAAFPVDRVRGKTVRYTGWIKTRDVESGSAGLFLRVVEGTRPLFVDSTPEDGRTGTTDWARVEIAVDVPANATRLLFGALLSGKGTAWVDGLDLVIEETVPREDVRVTGTVEGPGGRPAPGAVVAAVTEHGGEAAAVELSDERGRFSLVVPEGRYALTATAPGGTAAYLPPRALAGEAEIVLRLGEPGAGFRLAGRVTGEDGQGVDGARIECLRYSDEGGDVFYTRTGSDGRYEITLLRAHHQCSARKGERLARGVAIADGTARRDFILFAAGPAPAPVVDWIRDNAIPLLSVRAEHGFADMKPLRKLIGKARIVGLGEATHGTREFFQMKHRMLEFLVSEMGFTVFAIEATWPESEAVNEYVLTGKGDPATALAGMHFMVWNTEEVLELIEWMRRWNADPRHKRKVKFYGFDMQMSSVALARLLEFLEKVDAELADATRQRLGVLAEKNRKISREAIVENADAMKESLAELRRRLERGRRIYARKAGKRSSLKARQALRILEQFVEMTTAANPGALRDSSMAENLRWIADVAEPGAKIVAWAHNGHIATTARDGVTVMMGHHLEQALGAGYLRIGFAFHRGSFQAIAMNGDRRGLVEHTIGPAPPGSIGDTFQRAGWPLFVLDLRRLPRAGVVADWFAAGQIARATGIAFSSEEAMRGLVVLPDRFEALIFVESTTRARPTRTGHRAPR